MSKRLQLRSINLIEELAIMTLHDETFNPDQWSIWEGEQLVAMGEMIIREVKKSKRRK